MKKTYLLTPGPTPIPEAVSAAMGEPILHHRTPEFEKLFESVRRKLKRVFQTQNEVLVLAATGTGAMEAAVVNLCSPGDRVLVIHGGKFGERWVRICRKFGLEVVEFAMAPGEPVHLDKLETFVRHAGSLKAIFFQASETSTGLKLPTQEISRLAKSVGALSVCDAITAAGVFSLPMDEWGIDVLMTGSQKAFMLPPGLAAISLSEGAWRAVESSRLPRFYFDLALEKKMQVKNQTAWTPAISLIRGLDKTCDLLLGEGPMGLEETFQRHAWLACATRAGTGALGLELLSKESPSNSVTAVKLPLSLISDGRGKRITKLMTERFGVVIAGGQDELEGRILRLSHFGYCGPMDIIVGISALEMVLRELGHPLELGTGVRAVQEVLLQGPSGARS
jgi:aspartate aminotransferase-like enzyme